MKLFLIFFAAVVGNVAACNTSSEDCISTDHCIPEVENKLIVPRASCGANKICCPKEYNLNTMKFDGCGNRNIYGLADFKKAPKGKAQFAEFNSIVSVEDGTQKLCTGTLIDPKVVVTSASCVDGKNANSLKIRLGSWNAAKRLKFDIEEVKKVSKIILNSNTFNKNQQNVAILLLESPAKTGVLVGTSCLTSSKITFDLKKCAVVGWSGSDAASDNLNVQTVDLTACPPGSPAKSQCVNSLSDFDFGSALMCPVKNDENNEVMQVGVLSYKAGNAGVFADLTEFKDWIDTELKSNSIEPKNYTYSKLKSRFWWFALGLVADLLVVGTTVVDLAT